MVCEYEGRNYTEEIVDLHNAQIAMLKDELTFLKEALLQAAEFICKRVPKDARETGADEAYYMNMFRECAKAKLEGRAG